jgi:hypothetical protein
MPDTLRQRQKHYKYFLLSLWQEYGPSKESPTTWRLKLENPGTGEQIGFHDLEGLDRYLSQWMDEMTEDLPGNDQDNHFD